MATDTEIRVEFFGIPRERTGCAVVTARGQTLGEVLDHVAEIHARFATACLDGSHLREGLLANVNGRQFTTDTNYPLRDGDAVLILSAEVADEPVA